MQEQKTFRYDDVPPVGTTAGLVHGYNYDSMYIFKGIPYAQAKRFEAPMPVTPWEGVREATSYGYVCPLMSQSPPSAELMVPHRYWPVSEDCQNLNIWTDSITSTAKKPVLVWLHGGGFTAGSSIEQVAYDGFNMCREGDVVVVSINHRLNVLGYLDLSPFGEKYANSANAGHADMVAVLKWIHDNIAAFGGDPENVTLFGQSGGGMKISGLMNIPAADGLFHRGIVMSGVSDGKLMPEPKGDGTAIVTAMLAELGFAATEVEKLETVPYESLAAAYNKVFLPLAMQGAYTGGAPLVNEFFLGDPLLHGLTEHAKTISLMVGSVFGEFSFKPVSYDKTQLSESEKMDLLAAQYGENTPKLVELFRAAYPQKNIMDVTELDRIFRMPSKALAKLHAQAGKAPAYLYSFALDFPVQHGKPAWHCSDVPFFFHNTDLVEVCSIPNVTKRLETQIFDAVISFAKTGHPCSAELPQWPAVTPECEPTMIFDRESTVGINYDDALLSFADEISPPFNLMELMSQDVQH